MLQFFGIIIGILCFAALISSPVSTYQAYNDPLTLALLGIIGFVLLIAPIAKIPWAALVGFFAAIIAAAAVAFLTPPWLVSFITGYIDFKWVVLGVFIIIGLILFISLKWLEDLIKAFAMILASRPITFILMIVGIAQAILILYYPGGILHWLWPSIIPP